MKIHANTMMIVAAMFLLSSMITSKGVAEGANMIRQRNTRGVAEAASPVVAAAAAHTNQEQTAMELGMKDTVVEEEEEENLELDHYFRRTLQSSMASMADNVQAYPKVTIQNDTPYDTLPYPPSPSEGKRHRLDTLVYYSYFCEIDYIPEGIKTKYKWTGPPRGACLVERIFTTLDIPDIGPLKCAWYQSSTGTAYAEFFIIYVDGKCCVVSSHQDKVCPSLWWDGMRWDAMMRCNLLYLCLWNDDDDLLKQIKELEINYNSFINTN